MANQTVSAVYKPRCNMKDCFANKTGKCCEILVDYPELPCGFFKTREQVEREREEAHKKLADKGRWDLIEKYEKNRYILKRGGEY